MLILITEAVFLCSKSIRFQVEPRAKLRLSRAWTERLSSRYSAQIFLVGPGEWQCIPVINEGWTLNVEYALRICTSMVLAVTITPLKHLKLQWPQFFLDTFNGAT